VRPEEYEEWVVVHTRREKQWASILRTLMLEEPCDLTAIVFDGVDRIQHLCWRYISPPAGERLSPDGERIRQRCLEYFRELDGLLAGIVDLAGKEATVVFASDHGFGPQTGTFFLNAWLEERGHLAWADRNVPRASEPEALGIEQLARHAYLLDWEKTRAYAPTPSSNGVHIVRRGPGHPGGVAEGEYEAFRQKLAAELREATDPATGRRILSSVWTRGEVFAGPYECLAPDLTLELADGGLVSILASDTTFMSRTETSGTHRSNGVFMARGPGIARGVRLSGVSILDVPPVLLHSLGLEIPADMEGTVPEGVLEPSWLRSRPIRRAAAARVEVEPVPQAEEALFTQKDELELAQRLRDLGYID
jgi:predicted AlkP superfamily phosphohydrolase/phosphomutase